VAAVLEGGGVDVPQERLGVEQRHRADVREVRLVLVEPLVGDAVDAHGARAGREVEEHARLVERGDGEVEAARQVLLGDAEVVRGRHDVVHGAVGLRFFLKSERGRNDTNTQTKKIHLIARDAKDTQTLK